MVLSAIAWRAATIFQLKTYLHCPCFNSAKQGSQVFYLLQLQQGHCKTMITTCPSHACYIEFEGAKPGRLNITLRSIYHIGDPVQNWGGGKWSLILNSHKMFFAPPSEQFCMNYVFSCMQHICRFSLHVHAFILFLVFSSCLKLDLVLLLADLI